MSHLNLTNVGTAKAHPPTPPANATLSGDTKSGMVAEAVPSESSHEAGA